MKKFITAWVAALVLSGVVAFRVEAATGDACGTIDQAHYNKVAATDKCVMLCDGVSQTGGETTCGPIYFSDQQGMTDLVVAIEKAQTNCITSTDLKVQESNSTAASPANVWTTICTLTGVLDPLVSSCSFNRTPKGAVRLIFTALADADCTNVDVTATAKYSSKNKP